MSNIANNECLVTIGIPTYNRPNTLSYVLKCALRQSRSNIEILLADNATEPKEEIDKVIKPFLQSNKVRYFRHRKNLGPLGNFEFLISAAKGKHFIFFPDDDHYDDPLLVEKYVQTLEANLNASASMASVDYIDRAGNIFIRDTPPYRLDRGISKRFWNYLTTDITGNLMYGMIRRDVISNYHFQREVSCPEKFLILHLLASGPIIDCYDTGYKNIYSFKTKEEVISLYDRTPTRNHQVVWVKNAFASLPVYHAMFFLCSTFL